MKAPTIGTKFRKDIGGGLYTVISEIMHPFGIEAPMFKVSCQTGEVVYFPMDCWYWVIIEESVTFQDLVREGQELRKSFDEQTVHMRVLTPEDMKIRSK